MNKKRVLFRKIYAITVLTLLFTTIIGIQVMAATNNQVGGKINWKSNTKEKEIKIPDGIKGDSGKWESSTYTSSDEKNNSTSTETKPMSTAAEYGAIAAGLLGVLAVGAIRFKQYKSSKRKWDMGTRSR